jgi:hypothetical protein
MPMPEGCACAALDDLALVPMGGDGLDEQVFATMTSVQDHGGGKWWLHLVRCEHCGTHWMVAQEERIYDVHLLRRLSPDAVWSIAEGEWPGEFGSFERMLTLCRARTHPFTFLDPRSPTDREHRRSAS